MGRREGNQEGKEWEGGWVYIFDRGGFCHEPASASVFRPPSNLVLVLASFLAPLAEEWSGRLEAQAPGSWQANVSGSYSSWGSSQASW